MNVAIGHIRSILLRVISLRWRSTGGAGVWVCSQRVPSRGHKFDGCMSRVSHQVLLRGGNYSLVSHQILCIFISPMCSRLPLKMAPVKMSCWPFPFCRIKHLLQSPRFDVSAITAQLTAQSKHSEGWHVTTIRIGVIRPIGRS